MAVIVVGSVNIDIVVRVEQLPAPGETVLGSALERALGGKGANAAVAASRQGAAVRMVGCVGDDAVGAWALTSLADEGVDVSAVRIVAGESTGHALISVRPDGIGQIAVAPLANDLVTGGDVEAVVADVGPGDVVVAQLEVPTDAVVAAFEAARRGGATTVLDPAPVRPLSGELLSLVDVLMPNEHEFGALGGDAESLLRAGVGSVVVTRGERGCERFSSGGAERLGAPHVTAIDTTAAGDVFCGSFAAALSAGHSERDALMRALVAGALSTTKSGALDSAPTADDVDEFLRRRR